MFKIITNEVLVGESVVLTQPDVVNWNELLDVIKTDDVFEISVLYDNQLYHGKLSQFTDGAEKKFAVVFDRSVVFPSGVCIKIEVETLDEEVGRVCTIKTKLDIDDDTRLAAVDSHGCIIGYVNVSDLVKVTLCDLLPSFDELKGDLTSRDRILTMSGDCKLKAVLQSEIKCK